MNAAASVASVPALAASVAMGASLGVSFNPLTSLVAALGAGFLYGSPKRATPSRRWWAFAVVAVAWLLGDGFRAMGRLQDGLAGTQLVRGAPVGATFVVIAVWAAVGLLLGYVVPALVAITVGHGVVRGTGWLAAMAVGASCSAVFSALAPYLSRILQTLGRGA